MEETVASGYDNFKVAIYARAYEVVKMADEAWLDERFRVMQRAIRPDKMYLETHRDMLVVPEDDLRRVIEYFRSQDIAVAGGITITVDEGNHFETYCYTNEEHRAKLKEVVELTARNFNEFILDDFFFTNCTCESCIAARGNRTWTEFRLELLRQASHELILEPARRVNPNVKAVVKFPNWYEHYAGCGLNLEAHPKSFNGIYTGTETRDPIGRHQHLQEYLGYAIFRYLENVMPGGNGGGWVDPPAIRHLDRYAEQIWLTMFAKAPEITLFDFRQLVHRMDAYERAPWQNGNTSFDHDATLARARQEAKDEGEATIAYVAGDALRASDRAVASLGTPIGIAAFKPYHSTGEDFVHSYLGNIGIPIDLRPDFPKAPETVLLAESAAHDPDIVDRIDGHLRSGGRVVITSGLLRALEGRGIDRIADVAMTARKALVRGFIVGRDQMIEIDEPILVSQMRYNTNASWEIVSGVGPYTGYPVLHEAQYGTSTLIVLNLPDNWSDLYRLPAPILKEIREQLSVGLPVFLDAESRVSLFVYDNRTLVVASFRDEPADVTLWTDAVATNLHDLETGEAIDGTSVGEVVVWTRRTAPARTRFTFSLPPHSFRTFRWS